MKPPRETAVQASSAPPGPPKQGLKGNLDDYNRDTLQFFLDMRRYGPVAQFHMGPKPFYMVNEPECIQEVFAHPAAYRRPGRPKTVWKLFLGDGLSTAEGRLWERQRKLLQPAFQPRPLDTHVPMMASCAEGLAHDWQAVARSGEAEAVDTAMKRLTLRIVAQALFGADIATDAQDIVEALSTAHRLIEDGTRKPLLFLTPRWLPTAYNRQVNTALPRLDAIIQRFIDERRRTGADRGDFLSILLAARYDDQTGMTDKQVRDEALTLFMASYDTTSSALAWQWYLLSHHPDVEAKLHAEVDRVLEGRLPTAEDLAKLAYTGMVFKETMRLYPPVWLLVRETTADTRLAGYTLKRGRMVFLNVYGIQRDARYFPEPERFDPQRFSPENGERLPTYAYLPFGGGPRVCIGKAFALLVAPLITATLARHYRLELAPECDVAPDHRATLKPKFGLRMFIRPRESASLSRVAVGRRQG